MLAEFGRYERDYRVESASDGDAALARLGELRSSGDAVAMVVADLAMDPVDGVEVLSRVRAVSPTTKRILLLDWGLRPDQMDAVGRAATLGLVDSFLTKPTGPRDEEFHGAITGSLGDWAWTTTPVVEAVRVVVDSDRGRGRRDS